MALREDVEVPLSRERSTLEGGDVQLMDLASQLESAIQFLRNLAAEREAAQETINALEHKVSKPESPGEQPTGSSPLPAETPSAMHLPTLLCLPHPTYQL